MLGLTLWRSGCPVEICSALVRLKGHLLPQPATEFLTEMFYSQQCFLPSGVRNPGQVSGQNHCPRGQALYTGLNQVSLCLCACLACCQNPRLKQTAVILPQGHRGSSADTLTCVTFWGSGTHKGKEWVQWNLKPGARIGVSLTKENMTCEWQARDLYCWWPSYFPVIRRHLWALEAGGSTLDWR